MSTFVDDPYEPPVEFRLLLAGPNVPATDAQRQTFAARLAEADTFSDDDEHELCRVRVHTLMWALCMEALGAVVRIDAEGVGVDTRHGVDHELAWFTHLTLTHRAEHLPACSGDRCDECPW